MIYVKSFPGWKNFEGLLSHLKFVGEHQRRIERVAAVTDSEFLSIMPSIVTHFELPPLAASSRSNDDLDVVKLSGAIARLHATPRRG